MERDEHEMLIEYSEMTAFNFNSKEFQEVKKDFIECRDKISSFAWFVQGVVDYLRPAKHY